MNEQDLYRSLDCMDDAVLERSENDKRKTSRPWLKWGVLAAACLCAAVLLYLPRFHKPPETPMEPTQDQLGCPGIGPSSLSVNGVNYLVSSWFAVEAELPEGFSLAGTADVGGYEDRPYYTNPDRPEWVYVWQEVRSNGAVDATGTLIPTEPHDAYVRFVHERLRGKDLLCVNGDYYISMWSAHSYGDTPDVTREYYDTMESTYGVRMEGTPPEGFTLVGKSEFSGRDTIPRGSLVSNTGLLEVYANPEEPNVMLCSTFWYNVSGYHEGFNVYIRYDCPFAERISE